MFNKLMLSAVTIGLLCSCSSPDTDFNSKNKVSNRKPASLDEISKQLDSMPRAKKVDINEISLHEFADFNFQSKGEILASRTSAVQALEKIAPANYTPSEAVFGKMADAKPWWGLQGYSVFGPDNQRASEGAAVQSQFILNPALLVGVDLPSFFVSPKQNAGLSPIIPYPVSLEIDSDLSSGRVRYSAGSFFATRKKLLGNQAPVALRLVSYNAKDFGFNYIVIDYERSHGIKPNKTEKLLGVQEIKDSIVLSQTCGLKEGCNELQPRNPELEFLIENIPARVSVKLWKKKPGSEKEQGDSVFIVDLN